MENGRFNKLYEMSGIMKADMANVKEDIKFLLKRTDEIHTDIIKLRTIAAFAGGTVGLVVTLITLYLDHLL